jgi:hypothetical protein
VPYCHLSGSVTYHNITFSVHTLSLTNNCRVSESAYIITKVCLSNCPTLFLQNGMTQKKMVKTKSISLGETTTEKLLISLLHAWVWLQVNLFPFYVLCKKGIGIKIEPCWSACSCVWRHGVCHLHISFSPPYVDVLSPLTTNYHVTFLPSSDISEGNKTCLAVCKAT